MFPKLNQFTSYFLNGPYLPLLILYNVDKSYSCFRKKNNNPNYNSISLVRHKLPSGWNDMCWYEWVYIFFAPQFSQNKSNLTPVFERCCWKLLLKKNNKTRNYNLITMIVLEHFKIENYSLIWLFWNNNHNIRK